MPSAAFARDVVVIGGCGRVGLPLGIAFTSRGLAVRCTTSMQRPSRR